jgi:AcrR family transcriptional regulator
VNVIHIFEINDSGEHSERVSRKRQTRLRHIAREALALAGAEGSDSLTLQRLADRLDYTPGALYRYFASKEALIAELQRVVLAWLGQRTEETTAAALEACPDLDPGRRALVGILATARAFEAFAHDAPVEFGLLSMHLGDPEYRLPDPEAERVYAAASRLLAGLADRLEAAAEAGALRPGRGDERALALWASLQGAVQTRKLARSADGQIDPQRVSRALLTALLIGWGSDAETLAPLLERTDTASAAVETASLDALLAIDG